MSLSHSILVIGSLNVDYVAYTTRLPSAGETLKASGFEIGCGGKGANQAVACARASRSRDDKVNGSVTVRMLGAVGDDDQGSMMRSSLESNGVDVSSIISTPGEKTGATVIIVEETTGENRILFSPNANYSLRPELFKEFHALKPSLIVLQLEIPLETVLQILRLAAEEKVPVLLNPAPAIELPLEVFKGVTYLVVNETEAAILSGIPEADITDENLPKLAKNFLDLGTRCVIITLGGKGVYYAFRQDGSEVVTSGSEAAHPAKVVDTTAAGDTFVGAFSVTLLNNQHNVAAAVTRANRLAAVTVERKGAQASIPWANEVPES